MRNGPQYRTECPSIQRLVKIAAVGAVQTVEKSRVLHRDFSRPLWKPASFQGFHRGGSLHSAFGRLFHPLQTRNSLFRKRYELLDAKYKSLSPEDVFAIQIGLPAFTEGRN